MHNNNLVSVMMPVYNGMPEIKHSICSLLNQTYTCWECIIVNDGSTDETQVYLNTLNDTRFKIIKLEQNMGRPFARQVALNNSSGKYIAMLDADDFYHPEKLERQVAIMENNPEISLVSSGMCSFGENTEFIRIRSKGDNKIKLSDINKKLPIAHAPSLLRNELAQQYKYNLQLKIAEDIDFINRYLSNRKYLNTSDVLYYYSEFDSVNYSKIMKGYFYTIKNNNNLIYNTQICAKIVINSIIYLLKGKKYILKKRGTNPTILELEEFKQIKNILFN